MYISNDGILFSISKMYASAMNTEYVAWVGHDFRKVSACRARSLAKSTGRVDAAHRSSGGAGTRTSTSESKVSSLIDTSSTCGLRASSLGVHTIIMNATTCRCRKIQLDNFVDLKHSNIRKIKSFFARFGIGTAELLSSPLLSFLLPSIVVAVVARRIGRSLRRHAVGAVRPPLQRHLRRCERCQPLLEPVGNEGRCSVSR